MRGREDLLALAPELLVQFLARSGADEVLVAPSGLDSCILDWLSRR